ncbi:MAG TPA: hypothetical protein VFK41_05915 [Nocardioidaceae bacterium]|nr:hypothetical protein [Nocardioidaceae bacterium]
MGTILAVGVILAVVIFGGLVLLMLTSRSDSGVASDRAELAGLRELVADLKDIAYDHRELDSALATILIDRIRTYERQQRELP